MKSYLTQDERRQFANFRHQHPEYSYDKARYHFFKQIGKYQYVTQYTKHNSRELGYSPDDFKHTVVFPDKDAKFGWSIFDNGKYRAARQQKECCAKIDHVYAYATMEGQAYSRLMPLSSLIWLCFLKRPIPAGYVIDHIDENPLNNSIENLQCVTIGENTRLAIQRRKNKKL